MTKHKKNYLIFSVVLASLLVLNIGPSLAKDSSEISATTGWNGSLAFNPNNNTWLILSGGGSMGVNGRIIDNDGNIKTPIFRLDKSASFAGTPRVAFSTDGNKFLVVWLQEGSLGGKDTGDVYGRFIDPNGKFLTEPFNITPNDSRVPTISMLHYDSKNQRFIFAFAFNANIYTKAVSIDGVPGAEAQITKEGSRGAPALAVNEKGNEYCVSYQDFAPNQANMVAKDSSSVAVRRVDAATFGVGPETIVSFDMFFQGGIVYNSKEDKYFVTWTKYDGSAGLGKTLNSCNGTDTKDTEDVSISDAIIGGIPAYNPTSNTYAVISQDCCSAKNNYIVLDSSLNTIDQNSIFTDTASGLGNFAPSIAANTSNGTYAATSSDGYTNNRFIADLSSSVLVGKTYGGGGSNFTEEPKLSAPTQGLPTDLGQLIQQIFTWSLGILGVAVFVVFFYSGFLWLTAAGNTAKIGEAKTHMTNAIFGAILLLSSYLILYTINPDFVKNTVNLPGLGKQPINGGGEGGYVPADADTKHGNHTAEVAEAKQELINEGKKFPEPGATDECYRFAIVERAVPKIGEGTGYLSKPGGINCRGFAIDVIVFPDGYAYDVLGGSGDGSTPQWLPIGCGAAEGTQTCSADRYRAP